MVIETADHAAAARHHRDDGAQRGQLLYDRPAAGHADRSPRSAPSPSGRRTSRRRTGASTATRWPSASPRRERRLGIALRRARPPLPARGHHPVRRLQAATPSTCRAGRPRTRRRRVHRLLRRPLHGRVRRHPLAAAPEGGPAEHVRRLLDGRHGGPRGRLRLLGRAPGGRDHRTSSRSRT